MSLRKKFNRKINLEVQSHSLVNQMKRDIENERQKRQTRKPAAARKNNNKSKKTKKTDTTTPSNLDNPNDELHQV